jgi:phage tail-like protein
MPTEIYDEIYGSFFSLTIDGVDMATFTGCSGLNIEFDVATQKHINKDGKISTIKIPGKTKYSEVVLKRGYTADLKLNKWFEDVAQAKTAQAKDVKTGAITLYSRDFKPVAKFNLTNCWPSKLSVTDLNAASSDVMIEELTIQHEMIEWAP